MASRIVQYFADKLKTVKEYPITVTRAVYDENGNRLDKVIDNTVVQHLSHIGMVIHSTTLDTEDKVKAIYGGNAWSKIEGRMLLGASSGYPVNSTGGEATHTLTASEIPSHYHSLYGNAHAMDDNSGGVSQQVYGGIYFTNGASWSGTWGIARNYTQSVGGSLAHNNMPPYKTVYIWERTA